MHLRTSAAELPPDDLRIDLLRVRDDDRAAEKAERTLGDEIPPADDGLELFEDDEDRFEPGSTRATTGWPTSTWPTGSPRTADAPTPGGSRTRRPRAAAAKRSPLPRRNQAPGGGSARGRSAPALAEAAVVSGFMPPPHPAGSGSGSGSGSTPVSPFIKACISASRQRRIAELPRPIRMGAGREPRWTCRSRVARLMRSRRQTSRAVSSGVRSGGFADRSCMMYSFCCCVLSLMTRSMTIEDGAEERKRLEGGHMPVTEAAPEGGRKGRRPSPGRAGRP